MTAPDSIAWTTHPARDRPVAALAAGIAVLAAAILAGLAFSSLVAGVLALVLLVGSLRRFFLPTHYTVDAQGIAVRCLGIESRRPWSRFRRFRYDAHGGFLATRARPSRLDSFSGLHLTWNADPAPIVAQIERYIVDHVEGNQPTEASSTAVQSTNASL